MLGDAGHAAEGAPLSGSADADRRVRPLDRLGFAPGANERVVVAAEVGGGVDQQAGDDVERLVPDLKP